MSESATYNINNYVLVKLTSYGLDIMRRARESFVSRYPSVQWTEPAPDAEGYVRFQMWELMQLFGEHIRMGGPVPFETEVRLERRALGSAAGRESE